MLVCEKGSRIADETGKGNVLESRVQDLRLQGAVLSAGAADGELKRAGGGISLT